MMRPLAQGVRRLCVRCHPEAALGALNALLERELLGGGELLLSCLGLAEELEGSLILLIVEVIQPVAQQIARSARGGSSEQ
jgi:hypothetical protein